MAASLRLLPDIDIPLYLHDGPNLFFDAEAKLGYLAAAKAGKCECRASTLWFGSGADCTSTLSKL